MAKIALPLFIALLSFMPIAHANEAFTYAPEGCDFQATFPFEPGFIRRCPSDATQPCFEVAQFTDRADFDQTINVEMSCQIISSEIYETYTQINMEQIIMNMTRDANLPEAPTISFEEKDNGLKIASTSGIKTTGFSNKIFITQLWVQEGSVMSVEGEMSLDSDESADKKFADILRSIVPKGQQEEAEQAEAN